MAIPISLNAPRFVSAFHGNVLCLPNIRIAFSAGRGTQDQQAKTLCHGVREGHHENKDIEQHEIVSATPEEHASRKKLAFSPRIRARYRLVRQRLRRWSLAIGFRGCLRYLQLHSTQVVISTLFGCTLAVGFLWLKLTSSVAPRVMPYSELVNHLQDGVVTSVLFAEGSRQLFFNLKAPNVHTLQKQLDRDQGASLDAQGLEGSEKVDKTLDMEKSICNGMDNGYSSKTKSIVFVLIASLDAISSTFEQMFKSQPRPWTYSTRRIEHDEPYILGLMRERGVTYSSAPQPMSAALRTTLITILSLWIPLTPLFWLMHRHFSGGNIMAQKRHLSSPFVRFKDVAGVDEAKLELMEIVSYIGDATKLQQVGAKLPRGVLLVGPPGTGKTLLARAVAGETHVPFFAASASEFVEMFVGRGAARIRELFAGARKYAPSIIFIDELDAVGGRRGRSFNDERDQTLNQLTEMDGFDSKTGVLVMGATNRPEALDPALCRPGRFSRKVFVREPDLKGRQHILAIHMRNVPVDGDPDLIQVAVASFTQGFVGADLASVVNEAALLAVREGRTVVTLQDFKRAVGRVQYGIGNEPGFVGRELGRLFEWLQPKALKGVPSGYDIVSGSG